FGWLLGRADLDSHSAGRAVQPTRAGPGSLARRTRLSRARRLSGVRLPAGIGDPGDGLPECRGLYRLPEDLAKTLGVHVVNASCPGETTSSMINSAAPNNGCESTVQGDPGYLSFAPLHVRYGGSQLSYAVRYLKRHPTTELVTIDIGANDVFVCQQTTADDCAGADFSRELAKVKENLSVILSALRNQAHYRRALVVLTYYALNYSNSASATQTRELDAALTEPAARY